jgi:hypothetical protein
MKTIPYGINQTISRPAGIAAVRADLTTNKQKMDNEAPVANFARNMGLQAVGLIAREVPSQAHQSSLGASPLTLVV